MSTISEMPHAEYGVDSSMKTTKTDRYSSLLLAGVVMIGVMVMLLGALFILKLERAPEVVPVMIEPMPEGTENPPGVARDAEPPAPEEVEELKDPSLDETLTAMTDSISAALDVSTPGTGQGDSRRRGIEGEGEDIIPRYERWELKFAARDLAGYAKQLDHFEIELGAIGGGRPLVDYASNLSGTPKSRSGPGDQEQRIYFMPRGEGPLVQYDRQLLKKAGVQVSGRTVLKFISKEFENQLAVIENEYAKEKLNAGSMNNVEIAKRIAKTIFECQIEGSSGYQWVVLDQKYRTPRDAK